MKITVVIFLVLVFTSCKSNKPQNLFDRESFDASDIESTSLDAMHPSPRVFKQDTITIIKPNKLD